MPIGNRATGISPLTPTLRTYAIDSFLPWAQDANSLKPSTRKYYRYGWRLLENTKLADLRLNQITEDIIDTTRFYRYQIDRKVNSRLLKGQAIPIIGEAVECSEAYRQQALRTLKVILGRAFAERNLRHLSYARPKIAIGKTPGRDALINCESESAILRELSHRGIGHRGVRHGAWLIVMIIQDTGMRPSEVFAIRLEDIHWAERKIWIPSGKTGRARRYVGMSERMHCAMSQWCLGSCGPGWLFPSTTKSGHLQSIAGSFTAARNRAGLDKRLVLYSARHTFATYAMAETGNVFAVSRAMGHADVKSMEPYQHQDTSSLVRAINQRNSSNQEQPRHRGGDCPTGQQSDKQDRR